MRRTLSECQPAAAKKGTRCRSIASARTRRSAPPEDRNSFRAHRALQRVAYWLLVEKMSSLRACFSSLSAQNVNAILSWPGFSFLSWSHKSDPHTKETHNRKNQYFKPVSVLGRFPLLPLAASKAPKAVARPPLQVHGAGVQSPSPWNLSFQKGNSSKPASP